MQTFDTPPPTWEYYGASFAFVEANSLGMGEGWTEFERRSDGRIVYSVPHEWSVDYVLTPVDASSVRLSIRRGSNTVMRGISPKFT